MSLLTLLGLAPEEDAVYRQLVDRPDSEPAALTDPLSLYEVTRALDVLVERGLASARLGAHGAAPRYRAASPLLALGPLLEARRGALHQVEHFVTELSERHRAAQNRASGAPVEVLSGAAAIRRRLLAMGREAQHEVCSLIPARRAPVALSAEEGLDEVERDSMARGVQLRAVMERGWFDRPETAAAVNLLVEQGQSVTVADRVPIKMIIADRRTALLPLDPEREETEPIALVVHRSGLLTALQSLFDQCYDRATPLRVGMVEEPLDDDPIDAADRNILALLHVGLTDAAIARQLGMGHRTVQRRLRALMARAGAATRFQLGWHAARAGWLEPDAG
ncbi:helix-turn-helix transcriptional regulator [Streptomyces sp. VRA16 Mangrove soil]|uniref:helix-turn-helix transcriptional regulator n=1 Tax=Streptomyces sp. VRA16 Mangrove soil TaxID=2817434 RepID=UPI001A9E38DD|nr:helix-turn-helix transcriptional regulator [Streptomyces sp. VRA16 Mangrove soil]MBO1336413.1 helix-turn-helix transcriptional regulator [Streptomyces sp. VRA16 Mangrove soil]